MRVDLDEFEMVLEAKLFEKQQSLQQTTQTAAAPKSDKFGDVKMSCLWCNGSIVSNQVSRV